MTNRRKEKRVPITAEMTVLDIVSQHPETEAVFRFYDGQTGECICCQMLFETIHQVAEEYQLNLIDLLKNLNAAAIN